MLLGGGRFPDVADLFKESDAPILKYRTSLWCRLVHHGGHLLKEWTLWRMWGGIEDLRRSCPLLSQSL
jgi:hypothetical protein